MKLFVAKIRNGVVSINVVEVKTKDGFMSFHSDNQKIADAYAEFCAQQNQLYEGVYWDDDNQLCAVARTKKQALKTLSGWFGKQMKEAAQEVGKLSEKLETNKRKMHAAHEIIQAIREASKTA